MLDLVRAAMGTSVLTSLPLAPAADSKASAPDVAVRSFSTPSPFIRALGKDDALRPLVILGRIRMFDLFLFFFIRIFYICIYIYVIFNIMQYKHLIFYIECG